MNHPMAWCANLIALYALGLIVWTLFRRPGDLGYAFANLFRQKRRSLVTLSSIVLGGVAIFIFGGFVDYSFWALREQTIRTNLGHVQIYKHGYLASGEASPLNYGIENYQGIRAQLLEDAVLKPLIKTVTGQLDYSGIISNYESGVSTFYTAVGIEPESALLLGSLDRIVLGSDLSRIDHSGVTIGAGLARGLSASYDDYLDLLAVNPSGGQNAMSVGVRGILESGIKEYDDRMLKMPLRTAQMLLDTTDVSKIIVLLNDTDQTDVVKARIDALIAEENLPLETVHWSDLALFYHQVVNLFNGIFFFIKAIVSTIVIFMISNTMMTNVLERTREIGTLRALGLTRREVSRLFLLEGVVMGLLGALVSLGVGIGIAELINLNGVPMPPSPGYSRGYLAFIRWSEDWTLFWFSTVLAVVTAFAASILPARRAARLVIAEAFRHS